MCVLVAWLIYQLDAIEYLFVYFQLDMFRAYMPIFRSNGCYNFFTCAAYGVLGVARCRSWGVCVLVAWLIYQLDATEYLFVYFQLDMFRAYMPIFRSNGCYNFFTYAAYGVLGVARCRAWGVCVLVACCTATRHQHTHSIASSWWIYSYFKPKCKVQLP